MKLETYMQQESFHQQLKKIMNEYVHSVYKLTKKFPKEELYGMTAQLRRSAMSIILNYIEGYARIKSKIHKNSLEISYGSLKETAYLLQFASEEKFISIEEYNNLNQLADRIGAMLWGMLKKM